jgi:glycosyltransferase involved in cell wall biosynthesis
VQVRVIAMHNPGARTHEWLGDVEVFRPKYLWPERWEILQKEGGGLPVMWERNRWTRLVVLPFMLRHALAVRQHARGCDVIHANWTLSAALALPAKVIYRGHWCWCKQHGARHALRWVMAHPPGPQSRERVLVLATHWRTVRWGWACRPNVQVVPNGVDTEHFSPPSEPREDLLLFVGALTEIKGVRYLVEALPRVLAAWPTYRLVLVGEGPLRAELTALAQKLGVGDRVEFTGPQTPAQVQAWMKRARLFVLPSIEEGLGVVLLEALASGTPCSERTGGTMVTPEVGRCRPPPTARPGRDHWSGAGIPAQYEALSRQARQRRRHFRWDGLPAG